MGNHIDAQERRTQKTQSTDEGTNPLDHQPGGDNTDTSMNNGGSTDYYHLPEEATDLQDLIEHRDMNFSQGNMFKALYRAGIQDHSSYERDLNKIIWYAQRELARVKRKYVLQQHKVQYSKKLNTA